MANDAAPQPGDIYLGFNGVDSYVEIPCIDAYGVASAGALTVSAWMRPDALNFDNFEGTGYVYWIGKREGAGATGQQEWALRMYNREGTQEDPPRPNRISFYLFNPEGGLGVDSFTPHTVREHAWIHIVGVADSARTYFYRNGTYVRCDTYQGPSQGGCPIHFQAPSNQDKQLVIQPRNGSAPLRFGTRDFASYFKGGLSRVRIWSRTLLASEIADLYTTHTVPRDRLVAEFMLNAGTGQMAADTAKGNDGTIFNATWETQR
ncbi:MAG TPA: LamG domain-containing protein [Acetobacteraceae bacterium]|nr:LamG domain-containing protein [Acetobacteraceae bacterium]